MFTQVLTLFFLRSSAIRGKICAWVSCRLLVYMLLSQMRNFNANGWDLCMQQQEQSEPAKVVAEQSEEREASPQLSASTKREESASEKVAPTAPGFDWLVVGLILLCAIFFALTARLNNQPAPSFVPAAVLSATGCGLLVTALRKLRTTAGVGLLEAALGGLLLALVQFGAALTYPGVFTTLTSDPTSAHPFLLTWGLVGVFALLLSLAGAALGHLAFAPLRVLPAAVKTAADEELGEDDDAEVTTPIAEPDAEELEETQIEVDEDEMLEQAAERKAMINAVITVVLLAILPMLTGYVFAAAYDLLIGAIHADRLAPGLYPTLSLLGGLLPWKLTAAITLTGTSGTFIIYTLLWRIPDSFLGNPNLFDIQALEPLLLNAAALALLLTTMYRREQGDNQPQAAPWRLLLFLEVLLGLFLLLPADFWLLRGLEGILQLQGLAIPLPTIYFLNSPLFILNLVTGPLFCLLIGLVARRQYQRMLVRQEETGRPEA